MSCSWSHDTDSFYGVSSVCPYWNFLWMRTSATCWVSHPISTSSWIILKNIYLGNSFGGKQCSSFLQWMWSDGVLSHYFLLYIPTGGSVKASRQRSVFDVVLGCLEHWHRARVACLCWIHLSGWREIKLFWLLSQYRKINIKAWHDLLRKNTMNDADFAALFWDSLRFLCDLVWSCQIVKFHIYIILFHCFRTLSEL